MGGLRTIFMGTPAFACPTLETLLGRGDQVLAVFTQPDRPKGRGQKLMPPPVKELALRFGLPVYQPPKVREPAVIDQIRAINPDLIVVVAFGQILPQVLLDIPRYGCINVHASLLPRYRGAAPLNWCIINGENETGVTTMLMDAGLDTGPMLLKCATPIGAQEDVAALHDRMSVMGAELLDETIQRLIAGTLVPQPQDDSLSCYAPLLKKEHGLIDWNRDAVSINNQIRGLSVWPVASTSLDGQVVKIYRARTGAAHGRPGTILSTGRAGIEVACGTGSLVIEELQLTGKKRLDAASFLAGHPLATGAVFETLHVEGKTP